MNIKANALQNVIVVHKGLWSQKAKLTLNMPSVIGRGGFFQFYGMPRPVGKVEVEVDTLDNILKEIGISNVQFLKMDVEGAELDILKGAEESLKFTKNVAMELHYEGKEIKKFLEERGFEVIIEGNMLYARKIEQ